MILTALPPLYLPHAYSMASFFFYDCWPDFVYQQGIMKPTYVGKLSRRIKQVVNPLNKTKVHFNGLEWA